MSLKEVLILAIAVSLDAFGVSLSLGLNKKINNVDKFIFCLSFGFFQFLFMIMGIYMGVLFNNKIAVVPSTIGGIILIIVSFIMFRETLNTGGRDLIISDFMYIIVGVSVSIDALVIGFSIMKKLDTVFDMFLTSTVIGTITFILSALAFIISSKLKTIHIVEKYSSCIGSIILFIFGLKMIFM